MKKMTILSIATLALLFAGCEQAKDAMGKAEGNATQELKKLKQI